MTPQRSTESDRTQLLAHVQHVRQLPPYEAVLAYRDLVRAEAPMVLEHLSPQARQKHQQYLSTYFRAGPRRRFTDHNYARKLAPVVSVVRDAQTRRVLDAACGNGFEAVLFALHGCEVRANDCSTARCEIARIRSDLYRDLLGDQFSMRVSASNIVNPESELAGYDLVFVQEAISHIHPAERFLRLAATQYLAPGGRLAICDSNHWNPVTRARVSLALWRERRTLRHFTVECVDPRTGEAFLMAEERLFSPLRMRKMAREAGLVPDALVMSAFLLPALVGRTGDIAEQLLARIPLVRLFGGFYLMIARRPDNAFA